MSFDPNATQRPCNLSEIIYARPDRRNLCIGNKKRGGLCTVGISKQSFDRASELVNEGTCRLESNQENIRDILEKLAPLVLCKKYHQDQAKELVPKLEKEVERFNQTQPDTTPQVSSFPPEATKRRRQPGDMKPSNASLSSPLRPSPDTGDRDTFEAIEDMRGTLHSLYDSLETVKELLSPPRAASHGCRQSGGDSRPISEPAATPNERFLLTTQQEARTLPNSRITEIITKADSRLANRQRKSPAGRSPNTSETRSTSQLQIRSQLLFRPEEVIQKPVEGECLMSFSSLQDSEGDKEVTEDSDKEDEEQALTQCRKQGVYSCHKGFLDTWTVTIVGGIFIQRPVQRLGHGGVFYGKFSGFLLVFFCYLFHGYLY